MTAPFVSKGHVYFGSEDYTLRENSIVVQESSPGIIEVNLGFLQYNHRYTVTVDIPKTFFKGHKIQSILKAIENSFPNVNCRVISITDDKDFFVFELDFTAENERLMKEELVLDLGNTVIKVQFTARVLGPGMGTPLLKNGIKNVGAIRDDASEASDWNT